MHSPLVVGLVAAISSSLGRRYALRFIIKIADYRLLVFRFKLVITAPALGKQPANTSTANSLLELFSDGLLFRLSSFFSSGCTVGLRSTQSTRPEALSTAFVDDDALVCTTT